MKSAASIAPDEVARFSAQAGAWWDAEGPFRPLHRLNPLRITYVRDSAVAHFGLKRGRQVLKGLKVLDVGCGGGLLTESLARLGAEVTGLDASAEAIAAARAHADEAGVDVAYRCGSVEDMARGRERYDIVTAMEIAEHVADLDSFIAALARLVRPGGLLVMSTLNRTPKSFLLGIIVAEYVLRWVPRGTHNWRKFLRPSELVRRLEERGLTAQDMKGLVFDPLQGEFELSSTDFEVNYMLTAVKETRR